MRCALLLLLLLPCTDYAFSQDVVHFDDEGDVEERYDLAAQTAEASGSDVWIAFSVTRMMRENSVMGHFSGNWRSSPTIEELLDPRTHAREPTVEEAARRALDDIDRKWAEPSERLVPKQVAILIRRNADGRLGDVAFANMSMAFDTGGRSLYWIGHLDNGPAFDLLRGLYDDHRSDGTDVGEDLISAIGNLDTANVHAWLLDIVDSEHPTNEREQAVFWLGESDDSSLVRRLHALADEDRSDDVREAAVFALYRMDSDASLEHLIRLAREAEHEETAEKSRFWLSQKAGDCLVDGSTAAKPGDLEKQVVFALSRLDDEDAITELSSVARSHRNPYIRKQALFWLGQRGDDESLEAILEVLGGGL